MEWQERDTGALKPHLKLFLMGPEELKGSPWDRLVSMSSQMWPEPYLA